MLNELLVPGLLFIISLWTYLAINYNKFNFLRVFKWKSKNRNSKDIKTNTANYKRLFKRPENTFKLIYILISTLSIAYVLYSSVFFAVVLSGSMAPTFNRGDMVLMQNYDIDPQIGDIIMFKPSTLGKDKIVTHRVHSFTPRGIKTKGDARPIDNWEVDQKLIYSEAILIGEKPIVIKNIGYYFMDETPNTNYPGEFGFLKSILMKSKELGLLIFTICITLFVLLSLNDSIKRKQKKQRL